MTELLYREVVEDERLERVLRQSVQYAMAAIHANQFDLKIQKKKGIADKEEWCTKADLAAQAAAVAYLRAEYPGHGFVLEENIVTLWNGFGRCFTVDGLDGTGHFVKGRHAQVGSMVADVEDQKIHGACVGHLVSGGRYSFAGSRGVTHSSQDGETLLSDSPSATKSLKECRMLVRRSTDRHSPIVQHLLSETDDPIHSEASLAVWTSMLWREDVRMAVLCNGCKETPWDLAPIIGISQKLGYTFLRATHDGQRLEEHEPQFPAQEGVRKDDIILIHQKDLSLLNGLLH